jgi:hypothetical protein
LKCIVIEENNKFIKDQSLFEKDLDLYLWFFVSILTQFDFIFLFSYFMCIFYTYKCFDGGFVFVIRADRCMKIVDTAD